jgi:hypothetical protein
MGTSAGWCGAMTSQSERFREITEPGVIPTPSGAGAMLIHAEEGMDCHLVMGVFRPADRTHGVAIVTLRQCMQSVFGYPNDEAYWRDPRGEDGDRPGYGFYEVLSSTWPDRIIAFNRHAFPDRTPAHYFDLRHFFIGFHDASAEFLAESLIVEITDGNYLEAVKDVLRRIDLDPP